MSVAKQLNHLRERAQVYWLARTEQERKFLAVGGAAVLLTLVYLVLVAPALAGRAALERDLPKLREKSASLQAMAAEASELARQGTPQVAPMTRDALAASLAARSIGAETLSVSGEHARLALKDVPFASLSAWLDAQRREGRILVQEAAITAREPAGQVDATLTLRQNLGGQ